MTTLARLHAKHALERVLDGRAYRYSFAGDEHAAVANVTAHQMLRLLEGTDRASVLSRFVADLDPNDEQVLATAALRRRPRGRRREKRRDPAKPNPGRPAS